MKNHKAKVLFAMFVCAMAGRAMAYDAKIGDIYYDFSGSEATVTYFEKNNNQNAYKGDVVIPATVTHEGTTYNVTSIGWWAFANCQSMNSVSIPSSVTSIASSAFVWCSGLTSINIPSSVKTIGSYAFSKCKGLTSVVIPEGVTEIGDGAFYGCTYLKNLNLPASVQSIGDNGFAFCSKLQKMVVHAVTPPDIDYKTFEEVSRQTPVYVPDESVDEYENHPLWKEFFIQGISNMPTGLDEISSSLQGGDRGRLILHDGQIYILRGEKVYTLQGQEIK